MQLVRIRVDFESLSGRAGMFKCLKMQILLHWIVSK
jgi:hypothetical protein